MSNVSISKPSLKIRVSRSIERKIRQGHPWIFKDSISSQSRDAHSGELAVVYDHANHFLAIGLFDRDSPIRIRIIHQGKPRKIDEDFWFQKINSAIQRRSGIADKQTNGLRWIYGENDGLPGLVVDEYNRTLVLKIYSASWIPWIPIIQSSLVRQLEPERIILRLSRNISKKGAIHDGDILLGSSPPGPVIFSESGLLFQADVLRGQKTGFFLDQRENRRRVEELSHHCSILNTFSYTGGFSLYAARGGAKAVTSIDQSSHALNELTKNWELNTSDPRIRNCPHEEIQADVFSWLPENRKRFGVVIIDPPSLASRKADVPAAIKAYQKLAQAGLDATQDGGTLVFCSCSSHIDRDQFTEMIQQTLSRGPRRAKVINITGHAPDHPEGMTELSYLKALWVHVGSRK